MRFRSTLAGRTVLACFFVACLGLPAWAQNEHDNGPATYLALGDSVAFGYHPPPFQPASNYVGYPEVIGQSRFAPHLKKVESLTCPGETSASFLNVTAPDRGCQQWKATIPLHTDYGLLSQKEFAVQELRTNKKIRLVTLSIGGNDVIMVQEKCVTTVPPADVPGCIIAGLPAALTSYGTNLAAILKAIRVDAGYTGQIVLVTYYSPLYTDPVQTGGIAALNGAALAASQPFNVTIADGFGAFLLGSVRTGGDPCKAGLLVRLDANTCDVHPSLAGQTLLANAVLLVATGK